MVFYFVQSINELKRPFSPDKRWIVRTLHLRNRSELRRDGALARRSYFIQMLSTMRHCIFLINKKQEGFYIAILLRISVMHLLVVDTSFHNVRQVKQVHHVFLARQFHHGRVLKCDLRFLLSTDGAQ